MRITKYVLALVFSIGLAIPSFAVELSLGGFPSFMRFRWRTLTNATAHHVTNRGSVSALAASDGENINFADMTLRLTPQLVLSDNVTIRSSFDVLGNAIAGGANSGLFGATEDESSGVVMSDIRTSDRFNGTLLYGADAVDEDAGTFSVKFLHADINLGEYGFLRIGRQPFDFGLGIYANGGHDPYDDNGFNIDRILWLKGFNTAFGATTLILVSDYISGGGNASTSADTADEPLSVFEGQGQTVDYLAAAVIVANGPSVYGAYLFPKIRQKNLGGASAESNSDMNFVLYEAYYTYTGNDIFFGVDFAGGYGTLKPESSSGKSSTSNIDKDNYIFVSQLRFNNLGGAVSSLGFEYGVSPGDDYSTGDYEGEVIRANAAYEVDNLLFKHVIPSLYGKDGSVINSKYFKVDADMPMSDTSKLNLAVVMAWAAETDNQKFSGDITGASNATTQDIAGYWGTVYEATYSTQLTPGVELSLIGSYIDAGNGLKDAMSDAAAGSAVLRNNHYWYLERIVFLRQCR